MNGCTYLPMAQNPGIRVILLQLPQQVEHGAFLCIGSRISRIAFLVEPAFIADADALVVPAGDVGAYLMNRTADVNLTIARDIKMITDIGKSSRQMAAAKRLYREMTVTASSAAMNYQEAHLPIILIETSRSHGQAMKPVQAPRPKAPATAVATAMITLSIILHFEDVFSFIIV